MTKPRGVPPYPRVPCPVCGEWRSRVLPRQLRPATDGHRRWRVCEQGHEFVTIEHAEKSDPPQRVELQSSTYTR